MGEGATFWERNKTRVSYKEYVGVMAAPSLRHHMERTHGIVLPQTRGVDVIGGGSKTHNMSFPRVLKSVACPVEGCPSRANNQGRIR